jgi:hypothetical protein
MDPAHMLNFLIIIKDGFKTSINQLTYSLISSLIYSDTNLNNLVNKLA